MTVHSYLRPTTIEGAVEALQSSGGTVRALAGGTDLLAQVKNGREVGTVVDLKKLDDVMAITRHATAWEIGAGVPAYRIGDHEGLRGDLPGLVEGLELIGSTQIQGRATLGGNVANASPAADAVPALLVNDAVALIAGPTGRRERPVAQLITGPGTTDLAPGEFIVAFRVPVAGPGQADAALRFIPRTEMDIAVANAAVRVRIDQGRIAQAAVAIGAVGPRAIRVPDAEARLSGAHELTDELLESVAAACRRAATPIDDRRGTTAFRLHVVGVLVARASRLARERALARP